MVEHSETQKTQAKVRVKNEKIPKNSLRSAIIANLGGNISNSIYILNRAAEMNVVTRPQESLGALKSIRHVLFLPLSVLGMSKWPVIIKESSVLARSRRV